MSMLIFLALYPFIGEESAQYWATRYPDVP